MKSAEKEFDQLPEALRLALVAGARERLVDGSGHIPPVTPGQLAEAAGVSAADLHRAGRIAMMKLRAQAVALEIDLSDMI